VSFAAINLCVVSQRVCFLLLLFISLSTQSGNFWIHPRTSGPVLGGVYCIRYGSVSCPTLNVEFHGHW
jgi:hypothetical protein